MVVKITLYDIMSYRQVAAIPINVSLSGELEEHCVELEIDCDIIHIESKVGSVIHHIMLRLSMPDDEPGTKCQGCVRKRI